MEQGQTIMYNEYEYSQSSIYVWGNGPDWKLR